MKIKMYRNPNRTLEIEEEFDKTKEVRLRVSNGPIVCTQVWLNAKEIKILHDHLNGLVKYKENTLADDHDFMTEVLNEEF